VAAPRLTTVDDALAPERPAGEWTIVLLWNALQPFDVLGRYADTTSTELDSVLHHPDPAAGYIGPDNPGDLDTDPINAELLRDSAEDLEPVEALVISRLREGNYGFGVLRSFRTATTLGWGRLGSSQARVHVYNGGRLVRSFGVPRECGAKNWWHVFDLEGGAIRRSAVCAYDAPPRKDPPY
jgi:hypothetical protein